MALVKFGLAFELEKDILPKAAMGKELESRLFAQLVPNDYGDSVKNIAIGVIAVGPDHALAHPVRKPVYRAGKWRSKSLPIELEDTLEFDVKLPAQAVRWASGPAELADVLRRSLGLAIPALFDLQIPDFDTRRFVADLDSSLARLASGQP